MNLFYVVLGGSLGSGMRYLLATFVQQSGKAAFPFGTLAVNILGAFAAGFLFHLAEVYELSQAMRLLIFSGILGGFTTFSAYTLDSLTLLKDGESHIMIMNVLLMNMLGLFAVGIGYLLSKAIF